MSDTPTREQIQLMLDKPFTKEDVFKVMDAYSAACVDLLDKLATKTAQAEMLAEALEHFAKLPLEEFGFNLKKPDRPIGGFNDWSLTVGHILDARAALRQYRGTP